MSAFEATPVVCLPELRAQEIIRVPDVVACPECTIELDTVLTLDGLDGPQHSFGAAGSVLRGATYVRTADWFDLDDSPEPVLRPRPTMGGLREDERGLWFFGRTPAPDWTERIRSGPLPPNPDHSAIRPLQAYDLLASIALQAGPLTPRTRPNASPVCR